MIDGIIGNNCESKEKMVEKVYNRRRTLRDGQRSRSTSGEDSVYISRRLVFLFFYYYNLPFYTI